MKNLILEKVDEQIKNNPAWFVKKQRDYYKNGPYKVHLARRQKYMSDTVTKYMIEQMKDPSPVILDAGCGDGQNLEWLDQYAYMLFGVDYNHLRISRAKFLVPSAKLALMNMYYPIFEHDFFDIILCNHVIEHLEDPKRALSSLAHMLNPEGILILGVPNEGSEWWQLAYDFVPRLREKTDHKQFFTMNSLLYICQSAGFDMIEGKYMGYGLPHFEADTIFRQQPGMDDFMEELGHRYFENQASSMYLILRKQT